MNDFEKPFIIVLSDKPVSYNIYSTFWIPCSAKFITFGSQTSTNGIVQIHEVVDGKIKLFQEKHLEKTLKCGTFGASSLRNRHVATGDFFGDLNIWDLENSFTPIYSVQGHKEVINDISGVAGNSVGCGAPEIVTGSRDGYVKVWDPRQKEKPVAIMESIDNIKRECWAVAFGNSYNSQERVVCAGYDNGDIKMFDLRTMTLRWETTIANGLCSLEFDRNDIKMNKLLATGLEGSIYIFETRDRNNDFPCIEKKIYRATIWHGKHLPQNREIFVTCGKSLHLFKYHYCDEITGERKGSIEELQHTDISEQSINSFDWSPDKIGLAVCSSFDQTIRLLCCTQLHLH